jgi:hypothetical protein
MALIRKEIYVEWCLLEKTQVEVVVVVLVVYTLDYYSEPH